MNAPAPNTFALTETYRTGVIVLATISTISTVSVSLLLTHFFVVAFVSRRNGSKGERILLRTHLGAFVVCLFFSDLIQGMSGMMQIVWLSDTRVTTGTLCTIQAVMLQMGDVGTAIWNAVVAIDTFWAVVLGKRMTSAGAASLIAIGWTLCAILTMIGPLAIQTKEIGPFYGIAGAWCFITNPYRHQRVLLHYLPMLLSASIITVLYVLVALVLFGVLTVHGNTWRFKAPTRKSSNLLRDLLGQFSWGRLHPPPTSATTQSADTPQRHDANSVGLSEDHLDRGRRHASKSIGNAKKSATSQTQADMAAFDNPASARSLELKKIAIKMLWYPSVYLVLILPIAISRVDSSMNVSLPVILGFTCLFLFMGTANTIIFLCTRRLGPTAWSWRNVSASRSRSKAERGHTGVASNHGAMSMQVRVDRFTQRAIDDQSIAPSHKKSNSSILADISSMPPVMRGDGGFAPDYKDSKVAFDLTGGEATRHVLQPGSLSGPNVLNAHALNPSSPAHRDQPPLPAYTLPNPPVQRGQPPPQEQAYIERHPYSYHPSPIRASTPSFTFNEA